MKKRSNRWYYIISILVFSFLLLSCEFEPGSVPDSNISRPSETAPPFVLDITPQTDTLKVFGPVTIRYNARVSPRKVNWVQFAVDGVVVYERNYQLEGTVEMLLDIGPYADGLHELTLTFVTNTNSGSMADIIGSEGYVYTLEWPLFIDRTPGRLLKILSTMPVDRGVELIWETFNHPAFVNYTITKSSDSFFENTTLAVLGDPNINTFVDTTYLEGERATYTIGLNEAYGTYVKYTENPVPPEIEQTGPSSINISWTKTRNPGILDYYYLYIENEYPVIHGNMMNHHPDSISRTLDNISFGKNYKFNLQYIPKNYTNSLPTNWINKGVKLFSLGDSMEVHDVSRSVPGTDILLLVRGNQVYNYNIATGVSTPVLNVDFDISWSVNVSPTGDYFGYSANNEFIVRNTVTNEIISTLSEPVYDAANLFIYTLSANNRLLVAHQDGRLILYDLSARKRIAETNLGKMVYTKLAPDGNHVMVRDYETPTNQIYFEIVDSSFVEIGRLQEPQNALQRYFTYSPDNRLFLFYTGRVEIRNVHDFSLINQYDLPAGTVDGWDFDKNHLLVQDYSNDNGFFLDINTGEVLLRMNVEGGGFLNLKNGFITSGIGRKMSILSFSTKTSIHNGESRLIENRISHQKNVLK